MRVLLIVHGYPPRALGGTEIYTAHLARTLRQRPHEIFVLTREASTERPEYALRRERRDGVEVLSINHTFRHSRSFEDTYRNPAIAAIAARLLDDIRPDVAHIQHLTCLGTDLVPELARRRIPTCFTLNDYWLICHRGQLFDLDFQPCEGPHRGCRRCVDGPAGPVVQRAAPLWRRIEGLLPGAIAGVLGRGARGLARGLGDGGAAGDAMARRVRHVRWLAGQVSLFLAPSRTLHQRFLDFGFPAERLRTFEQGIDPQPFAGRERTPAPGGTQQISRGALRIGFLGSLMVSKAPHLLLEAFAGLPPGSASLEIYGDFAPYHGDDGYRRRLEPLLAATGVRHHGPVPNAEVPRALAAIDVLVVPSMWWENAPFVIREAFAAGVPVVASDRGGMAEMVEHEKSGLLFRPGDAVDLRRTLERLIAEPELRRRLSAGIPRPRTIEEVAGELREIYRTLPRQAPPPRLAAVVLNYRTPRETLLAVRSLASSARPVDDILVVDNASGDGSEAWLREHLRPLGGVGGDRPPAGVRLLAVERNLGFSGGSNAGIRAALDTGAERVLLLNGDAMVAPGCVGRLEEALAVDPEAGIAGPALLAAHDPSRVASCGIAFSALTGRMRHPETGRLYDPAAAASTRRVAAVSGCGMLVERRVFEAVGLLDEDYFFSFEDLDFCLRAARAGFATVAVGDAVAYHHGGRSIGPDSPRRLYFAARNHLLAAQRGAPVHPLLGIPRAKVIIALNLAFAFSVKPRVSGGLGAVARGVLDHLRRRYGEG